MRQAVRIGASSMRVKPFRLIFTILLSFIALTLFGLSSTLMFFDRAQSSLRSYRDLGYETLTLENNYQRNITSYMDGEEDARWTESTVTNFTPDDLDAMRAQYGESVLGVYDYFSSAFGPTNIGNGGARPISYYSDYWIDGFAQVDAEDTFWEERLLTDTDLSELGTDGIIISSYMFDCIRYYKLYENAPYREEYELNDYDDVVGKPLKFNARDGTNVTLTIRGVFRADLPAEYEPLKDYSLNTYNPEMRALASRLDVEMEYGIYNLALVSDSFYEANYEHFISGNGLHALNYTIPAHQLGERPSVL